MLPGESTPCYTYAGIVISIRVVLAGSFRSALGGLYHLARNTGLLLFFYPPYSSHLKVYVEYTLTSEIGGRGIKHFLPWNVSSELKGGWGRYPSIQSSLRASDRYI